MRTNSHPAWSSTTEMTWWWLLNFCFFAVNYHSLLPLRLGCSCLLKLGWLRTRSPLLRSWCSLGPASFASVTKLAGGDQGQAAWMLTRIDFAWAEEKGAAKFTEFSIHKTKWRIWDLFVQFFLFSENGNFITFFCLFTFSWVPLCRMSQFYSNESNFNV